MKLLSLLLTCLMTITLQAQTIKCHIDGPANVRQQPNTKSAVMGSIKNGMVATVSHESGNMWKIRQVSNPHGGSAYTGKVIGYYTHKQNLIFDMGNSQGNSSISNSVSRSSGNASILASLRGTWEGTGTVDGANVVLTVMAFDGSTGWAYTNYKRRTIWNPDVITISSLGNNEYGIYNGKSLFAKYTRNGNLIDVNGVTMKKVSNDVPAEPFTITIYFSNSFAEMGEYGIKEQYAYKHLIEQREGTKTGNTNFRIFSRERNVLLWEYKCGRAQNSRTDRVRSAIDIQFLGKETHSGEQSKVTLETDYSNGKYKIYTSSTNSDFLMYNCTLMNF